MAETLERASEAGESDTSLEALRLGGLSPVGSDASREYPDPDYWCYRCNKEVNAFGQNVRRAFNGSSSGVVCSECKYGFVENLASLNCQSGEQPRSSRSRSATHNHTSFSDDFEVYFPHHIMNVFEHFTQNNSTQSALPSETMIEEQPDLHSQSRHHLVEASRRGLQSLNDQLEPYFPHHFTHLFDQTTHAGRALPSTSHENVFEQDSDFTGFIGSPSTSWDEQTEQTVELLQRFNGVDLDVFGLTDSYSFVINDDFQGNVVTQQIREANTGDDFYRNVDLAPWYWSDEEDWEDGDGGGGLARVPEAAEIGPTMENFEMDLTEYQDRHEVQPRAQEELHLQLQNIEQNVQYVRHILRHLVGGDLSEESGAIATDLADSNFLDARGFEFFLQQLADDNPPRGAPPAAKSVLDCLPCVNLGQSHVENETFVCAICKEVMAIGEPTKQLPCMHLYHSDCILTWLTYRNSCPVCRFELPTDDAKYEIQRQKRILQTTLSEGLTVALIPSASHAPSSSGDHVIDTTTNPSEIDCEIEY